VKVTVTEHTEEQLLQDCL